MSGIYPVTLEALDGLTVAALDRYEGTHYAEGAEAMLIFRLDTGGEASLKIAEKILTADHAKNIQVTRRRWQCSPNRHLASRSS